ncbi:MAG: carboxypeptidase regulatory-like domain-containing protein [Candidatus Methanofastidiosia archaeon]
MKRTLSAILMLMVLLFGALNVSAIPGRVTLKQPSNGSTISDTTPTFKWLKPSGNVTFYHLQVTRYNDTDFSEAGNYINRNDIETTQFTPDSPMEARKYRWRVRARDSQGWGTWSFVWSFTIKAKLETPELKKPENNLITTDTTPKFEWTDPNPNETGYTLQVHTSTNFTSPKHQITLASNVTSYDGFVLTNGTWYWRVRANASSSENNSNWSEVRKLVLDTETTLLKWVEDDDGLHYEDGETIPDQTPKFVWENNPHASGEKYRIQISRDSVFSNIVVEKSSLTTTNYTSEVTLSDNETYYWRVRYEDYPTSGETGNWSAVWSILINVAALSTPSLISPQNNITLSDLTPTFTWSSISSAGSYEIEVSENNITGGDGSFTSPVIDLAVASTSYTPTQDMQDNTLYYWHVRAVSPDGKQKSSWSDVFSFTLSENVPPILKSPEDGSRTSKQQNLTLEWETVQSATQYELEYSTDEDFLTKQTISNISGTSVQLQGLQDGTTYYWHVRVSHPTSESSGWSSTWNFVVDRLTTDLAYINAADNRNNSTITTSQPIFYWYENTNYGESSYKIQIAVSSSFTTPIIDSTVSVIPGGQLFSYNLNTQGESLADGTYYWRVKMATTSGAHWSDIWSFLINTQSLQSPTLQSPADGSILNDSTPLLSWSSVSGANKYNLQVAPTTDFGSPTINLETNANSYQTSQLNDGTYYWRVRAINPDNLPGEWSTIWAFSIDTIAPTKPTLYSPIGGQTISDNTPDLKWTVLTSEIADISLYKLEYTTNPSWVDPVVMELDATTHVQISWYNSTEMMITYSMPSSLSNGTYYWRVKSQDRALNTSISSSVEWFILLSEEQPPQPGDVTITVKDVSGNPIEGASVTLDTQTLQTTSSGMVIFPNVSAGTHNLVVTKKGYNSSSGSISVDGDISQTVVLTEAGVTTYTITVVVKDPQGSAIQNATVKLIPSGGGTTFTIDTNQQGNAVLENIPQGSYTLEVTKENYSTHTSTKSVNSDETINVTLSTIGTNTVTISVKTVTGTPINGAIVTLTPSGGTGLTLTTDASGTVTYSNIESGSYSLTITAQDYETHTETFPVSGTVTKEIVLISTDKGVIHGKVYYDDVNTPAQNVTVRIYETESNLVVQSVTTDANGWFAVEVPKEATYYIIVESYTEQKRENVQPSDSLLTGALEIIIQTEGEIRGVVADAEGNMVSDAKVTLRNEVGDFVESALTGAAGNFSFKVKPGQYYVEIIKSGYQDYTSQMVTVPYKGEVDLQIITLQLISGTLQVRLEDEDGEPVDGTVKVIDSTGRTVATLDLIAGEGSKELAASTYTLIGDAKGYKASTKSDVLIESGKTTSETIVLGIAPGVIDVRVYMVEMVEGAEKRSPVAEAQVYLNDELKDVTDENGFVSISNLPPGEYTVKVLKEGFVDYNFDPVVLSGEQTMSLEAVLEKKPTYTRSILIGGLVILALIVVGALALRTMRKPKEKEPSKLPARGRRRRLPPRTHKGGLPERPYK